MIYPSLGNSCFYIKKSRVQLGYIRQSGNFGIHTLGSPGDVNGLVTVGLSYLDLFIGTT